MKLAALRWSALKQIGKSPAHYKYHLEHPIEETDAMRVGSRVHDLVLHGGRNTFATWRGGTRRGKQWDQFKIDHSGQTLMTGDQEDRCHEIASAVLADPAASEVLFGCVTEQERFWSIAGRECRGTPDAIGPSIIADLKVTNSGAPERFKWHALRMGYLAQLAWYDYGLMGGASSRLSLIAVEDKPPYVVTVYDLSAAAAEQGHRTWRSHFERLRVCEDSGVWPGYSEAVVTLDVESDFTLHIGGEEVELEQ